MPDLEALPGLDDLRRQAEAVLFSLGAPIERRKLADTLEVDLRTLASVLDALDVSLEGRGLMLQRHDDLVQLVTRPEASAAVRRLLNPEVPGRLSPAAYETLAIIAYRQPIGRSEIEEIRGVGAGAILKSLHERGLIDVVGRGEGLGRPLHYGTTPSFLEQFALRNLEELPRADELAIALRAPRPATSNSAVLASRRFCNHDP